MGIKQIKMKKQKNNFTILQILKRMRSDTHYGMPLFFNGLDIGSGRTTKDLQLL